MGVAVGQQPPYIGSSTAFTIIVPIALGMTSPSLLPLWAMELIASTRGKTSLLGGTPTLRLLPSATHSPFDQEKVIQAWESN